MYVKINGSGEEDGKQSDEEISVEFSFIGFFFETSSETALFSWMVVISSVSSFFSSFSFPLSSFTSLKSSLTFSSSSSSPSLNINLSISSSPELTAFEHKCINNGETTLKNVNLKDVPQKGEFLYLIVLKI